MLTKNQKLKRRLIMNKLQGVKTLKFKYKSGMTKQGKEKYSYNTISNVSNDISDEIAFGLLELIGKVQELPSEDVQVIQSAILKQHKIINYANTTNGKKHIEKRRIYMNTLKLKFKLKDNKQKTISIKNVKKTATQEDIKALGVYISNNSMLNYDGVKIDSFLGASLDELKQTSIQAQIKKIPLLLRWYFFY